jgi:Protein of unknown function (DUF3750)
MAATDSSPAQYTVTIYASRLFFPIWFAVHTHIVIEYNGVASRYDIFSRTPVSEENFIEGYLRKNVLPPKTGLFMVWPGNARSGYGPRWGAKKCGLITGGENSVAQSMYHFFEQGFVKEYPHLHIYKIVNGPNSNTFTQWVLDQFPEAELKLPFIAWGKRYKW